MGQDLAQAFAAGRWCSTLTRPSSPLPLAPSSLVSHASTWRLLKPHVIPRLPGWALVFVLTTIMTVCKKAPIFLLGPLWNRVLFPQAAAIEEAEGGGGNAALNWIDARFDSLETVVVGSLLDGGGAAPGSAEAKLNTLITVAVALTLIAFVSAVAQFCFTLLSRWIGLRMIVDLRLRIAEHLMSLSLRYHSERRLGDLLSRISNDVGMTLHMIEIVMKDLIKQPMMIAGAIAAAATIAPKPTLFAVLGMPLLAVPISVLGRRVRRKSRKSLRVLGASVQALTQMFRGIRTVKSFRAEEREVERYREINHSYMHSAMKVVRAAAWIQGLTSFVANAGLALLVFLTGWVALSGHGLDTGSQTMMFFLAISMVYEHIRKITGSWNKVQESQGASQRLLDLFDEGVDIQVRPDALPIATLEQSIRFENVSFRYESADRLAIDGLELEIRRGETLALVGPSGSGKTTTIDLIARFLDPTDGRVSVDGKDLRDLSLDDWTHLYALVGQDPFLFHDTIGENILYGRPGATHEEVVEAACAANIHEFIESLPEGYATRVGDDGERLSGGQRQRITIARAILKGAPILLLDEATSALDSEAEAEVQAALDRLMSERTVIVIAHRLSTIRNADRICVLESGRGVELGTHDDLIAANGTYRKLHDMQFGLDSALEGSSNAAGDSRAVGGSPGGAARDSAGGEAAPASAAL